MNSQEIRSRLIAAGVRNLQEFGYPSVNKDNILTDYIYSQFFRRMLVDNLLSKNSPEIDKEINVLLEDIDRNIKKLKKKTKK